MQRKKKERREGLGEKKEREGQEKRKIKEIWTLRAVLVRSLKDVIGTVAKHHFRECMYCNEQNIGRNINIKDASD